MEWYKLGKHRWKCFNLNSVIIKKKKYGKCTTIG